MERVSFTRMDQGTPEDFALLRRNEEAERADLPGHVLTLLEGLRHGETGYQVNRHEHSLQAATRALRDDADAELVVCALLHDIGDLIAPDHHAALAATLVAPYVSERARWIVEHHGIFQGYYYFHHWGRDRHARAAFEDHPWYEDCRRFCDSWDQVSFDPNYPSLPLEAFEPLVAEIFGREPWSQAKA